VFYDQFYCILINAFGWLKYRYSPDNQVTDDEMDRTCGAHGGRDKCIHGFGKERKDITQKTYA
jgi:hypothetical protein